MLLMHRAVTFSLDIEIQDLMVECSNFWLVVPLKLNESYSLKAKKDIKELTLQVALDKFIFSFHAILKKFYVTALGFMGYANENEVNSLLEDCRLFFLHTAQKI